MPSPEAWFSWVCGLPWVTSFQEQSPGHCPRRRRAHHWYRYHGNASHEGYRLISGTPHLERLGGSGVRVLAGGGARAGWGVLSAVACSSSMPCMLPFVFPTLRWGACPSPTECHGRYGRSQLKASKLLCRSLLPGYRIPFFFLSCSSEVTLNYMKPREMCSCFALLTMPVFLCKLDLNNSSFCVVMCLKSSIIKKKKSQP